MAACAEEHNQETGQESRQQSSAISLGLVEVFDIIKGITDINKYLLSKYSVPGINLDAGDKAGNKRDENSCPHGDDILVQGDRKEKT